MIGASWKYGESSRDLGPSTAKYVRAWFVDGGATERNVGATQVNVGAADKMIGWS